MKGVLVLALAAVSCRGSTSWDAVPSCENGPFARELAVVLPPFAPLATTRLAPADKVKRSIEPGCMIPFRDETGTMDETLRDVGRVIVKTRPRGGGAETIHGRNGRLWLGRHKLHLEALDDGGTIVLHVEIKDRRVLYRRKGAAEFAGTIEFDDTAPLPAPLDAMVEAITGCAKDVRLGVSDDGNIIEAKRGGSRLWRTRYLDGDGGAADTSMMCAQTDARFAWRSTAGALTWTFSVASARAPEILTIAQLQRSETEDSEGKDMGPQFDLPD
jgi:hypothetical protein